MGDKMEHEPMQEEMKSDLMASDTKMASVFDFAGPASMPPTMGS